jgi:hypothetical protein
LDRPNAHPYVSSAHARPPGRVNVAYLYQNPPLAILPNEMLGNYDLCNNADTYIPGMVSPTARTLASNRVLPRFIGQIHAARSGHTRAPGVRWITQAPPHSPRPSQPRHD